MQGFDPNWMQQMQQYPNEQQMGYQGNWDQFVPPQQDYFYQEGFEQQYLPEFEEMGAYPPQYEMYGYPAMQQYQQYNQLAALNPVDFNTNLQAGKFFVIKSYSEDDIHKSIKYNVWSSTREGNGKLDSAFKETNGQFPIYLFFSVNASGQFVGVAEMKSQIDPNKSFGEWAQQGKWMGQFDVQWIYVKDVPNKEFRNITLENNEGKPVTNSRDTQEIPLPQACQMLAIFKVFKNRTSILDDFDFYDKRQIEMDNNKQMATQDVNQGESGEPIMAVIKSSLNPNSVEFQFKGPLKSEQNQKEQT